MSINPIQFAHQICDEFLRYIFSAFPLADPDLAQQARNHLQRPSSLDIPLVKGPYVSLSEPYAEGTLITELVEQGVLHRVMPALIGYAKMYKHQQEVFESVRRGEHTLISTGTGSGKTEAFLYPIVDELLRERDSGTLEGLHTVIVYPMNALANDQLDRLRDLLGGTGITFGQWIGSTPASKHSGAIDRFERSSRDDYLAARCERREKALRENRPPRLLAPPEECCSEKEIRERNPRILLTNYRQLEILTTRQPDVELFAQAPLRYIVFDEAHTYEGTIGAEVACLIRRLRLLAEKLPDEVICIGTSATLTSREQDIEDDEAAAIRFASRFFGVEASKVTLVGESYVKRQWPKERYRPAPPGGDGMERLNRLLKALEEPVEIETVSDVFKELTGWTIDATGNWRESLHRLLLSNEYVHQCARILERPNELDHAGWLVSHNVEQNRLPEGAQATGELLAYLVLGAAARENDQPLLRPKVHFFIRGLDEMVVALNGSAEETVPELFLSLKDAKEHYAERGDDAFLSILTCTHCGQHFFEQEYLNLKLHLDSRNRLAGLEDGDAVAGMDDTLNAVWPTATGRNAQRLVMTNRLLEEIDEDNSRPHANYLRVWVCRRCGALHRYPSDRCQAPGCEWDEPLLPLYAIKDRLTSCPSCGTTDFRIGGRTIEPARKIRAVTVSDVHILAQGMINAAPEGHKKLVIFADSRQEAAFQAGWMQDHARRIRLRHMIYEVIRNAQTPPGLSDVVDTLALEFQKDKRLAETLLPELFGSDADATFAAKQQVRTYNALRYMLLREFTTGIRRRDCLESMGLVRLDYDGLDPKDKHVQEWAQSLGITPEEAVNGLSLILDIWRRDRKLYVDSDPIFTRYHSKDDSYIQSGILTLREFHPKGLLLQTNDKQKKHAQALISEKGKTAIQEYVEKWAQYSARIDREEVVEGLWDLLTQRLGLLKEVTIKSQKDRPLANVFQVDSEAVKIVLSDRKERCTKCQRLMTRPAPGSRCMRYHCDGTTVTEAPDQDNYDVALMHKPFRMVSAEEHTAQVPAEVREQIENDFKSEKGLSNCLVATPTLELGIDIGALDMVLMRNVPPRAANYWQRSGRAGRQERMSVVTTYCERKNHDRYFFEDPLRLLGGSIQAPAFNLHNPLLAAKHIRSAILSNLLLWSEEDTPKGKQTAAVLQQCFPNFIRDYLLTEENAYRNKPASTAALQLLLTEYVSVLADSVEDLFAQHWPEDAAEVATRESIESVISNMACDLDIVLNRLFQRLQWARNTQRDLHERANQRLLEPEEKQLLRRCRSFIEGIVKRERQTYTLSVLGAEGYLPGYGVYEGGITAFADARYAGKSYVRAFDLSRNNTVALREFVPGNKLYANRGTFYVARYHLPAEESAGLQTLQVNVEQSYVADGSKTSYGQSGTTTIDAIPISDLTLAHMGRITEDENLRFMMPVVILGRLRKRNRGGDAYKISDHEVHHIRGQGIQLVNVGEASRAQNNELGYLVCRVCGATKSPYAVDREQKHFLEVHKERCGRPPIPTALQAQADVDMLQFHELESQYTAVNIGEALRLGATRMLDMGEDDLQILVVHRLDEKVDLLVYDPMPGGSGLIDKMLERWQELITASIQLLHECPSGCEKACYGCLKTYRNQFHHELLDRFQAIELIAEFDHQPDRYRSIEPVSEEHTDTEGHPSNTPEARLLQLLIDHHFPPGHCRKSIRTSLGISTSPDWVYEDTVNSDIRVAVYLDGMSRHLHGDPKQAKKDSIIRQALELDGYEIIVIQSRDLDDPEAMRQHLRNIARAIGREGLV